MLDRYCFWVYYVDEYGIENSETWCLSTLVQEIEDGIVQIQSVDFGYQVREALGLD